MSAGAIIVGLLFSGIGFVGLSYGRKTQNLRMMGLGGALMIYPYFVTGAALTLGVGVALTALLWNARE